MSASPAAPFRSNRHRSRYQRSLIFPSSTVLHEPVPRDGMGLPTLLWLGQYSPHIVAGRQPSRQPEAGPESSLGGHGAKGCRREVVEMFGIAEAAPPTAHHPAVQRAVIRHLDDGEAARRQNALQVL